MTRTIDDLVETLRKAKDRGRKCTLLIGAGCSVKAGIPTAAGFVDIIRSEYPQAYNRAGEKSYPASMSQLALSERRDLIARYVDKAKINWAHIAIAQLMKSGYVDRVLTTNFDSLIVRACALLGLFPAAYDFAVSQVLKPGDLPDMAIFYLHGQRTGFVLMNTKEECEDHSKLLAPLFDNAGQGRVWLVVGYSGENDPVFDHLAATKTFDNNLYWVGYKQDEPKQHVREKLLTEGKKYAFHISGYDADDFFVTVAQKLDCFPPDFVTRPFPYLESLLSMVTPYSLPGEGMEMDLLESARQKIQAAVDHDRPLQEGGASTGETEKPVSSLIEEARQLLVAGEYDKVLSLRTSKETIGNFEYTHLIAWAHVMQGNILDDQARTKNGAEADRLWTLAGEKNAAALAIKPDMHEALYNWGLVLANQAETKSGAEADRLFSQAEEKYAAALAIKPDKHEALYNWGLLLANQAKAKSGAEADRLFIQAEEKYAAALAIKPDKHEALLNWGTALSRQAEAKNGAEADRLFSQAEEKYAAALAIKPDKHEALLNWGTALSRQARTKNGAEADRLWTLAGEKNAAALAIKPDKHEALLNWGLVLDAQARTKSGAEADRLFSEAEEKYAAALAIKPDFHEAYNSWAGALLSQAEGKSKEVTEGLLRQAEERARKAESLAPGAATYNLACIEARKGNEDSCRAWLIKSKECGTLPSREHLLQDPDLCSVRQRDWFQDFLG